MDRTEERAKSLLESLKLGSVRFEPRGQATPDFLLDEKIAVEVTRLTKAIMVSGETKVIDTDEVAIRMSLHKAVESFNGVEHRRSVYVNYRIHRPVDRITAAKRLRIFLRDMLSQDIDFLKEYVISEGLRIHFLAAEHELERPYFSVGHSDRDRGGWVVADLLENIPRVAEIKRKKALPVAANYSQWWLMLENVLTGSVSEYSLRDLIGHLKVADFDMKFWNRCLIFDPSDPFNYNTLWHEGQQA